MKSTIFNFIQHQSLRLSICAIALMGATVTFAQDDVDDTDSETVINVPKRKTAVDKNPTITVQGYVYDVATKKPVAGVRLQTLNDNRYAAMTDAEGKFSIKVPTFATALYVETPNYISQQVAIRANDPNQMVKIALLNNRSASMYENGTSYTAKRTVLSDESNIVIDDEISEKLGADVRTILRSGTKEMGAAMFIRGINSINANSQPLIIVDGVEFDMQRSRGSLHDGDIFNMLTTISPEDIDKVTVLKNATALYGARGGNGVILIETKRGHSMATRIDAKASAGITLIPETQTVMNASQYRNYAVEMLGTVPELQKQIATTGKLVNFNFLNDDPTGYYYPTYHNDTDWKDYVYREAITQNYSINVQGGDDVGMYNLSVGYLMADKGVKKTSFDRMNVRFNTDLKLLAGLTARFDMSFSRTNSYLFDDGFAADLTKGAIVAPTKLAQIKSPLLYPYTYNQNIGAFTKLLNPADNIYEPLGYAYSLANPVAMMQAADGDRKNKNENTFFNAAIEPTYEINDHLKITSLFSYYLNRNSQAYYRPNSGVPSFYVDGKGMVYSKPASVFAKETNALSNTYITWENKYGAHNINVVGGFRYNYFSFDNSILASEYDAALPNDKNPSFGGKYKEVDGANDIWKNMQWYASADYNYMNKYFATVSILAEANSRFGENIDAAFKLAGVQWNVFPSVQLGWVLTNENWFPKNAGINYLRINAGFDMSGNDDISNYAAHSAFTPVRYNNTEVGAQLTNIGNDLIKNETTTKYNIGVQANFLNNRLSVSGDFYLHETKDLLALKSFKSPVGGINNYWVNDGKLQNHGYEVIVSGKPVVAKNWNLELGASIGHYNNEIKSLANGDYTTSVYGDNNILTSVGRSVGMFYGYETNGVLSTDAQAKAAGLNDYLYMLDAAGNKKYFTAGDVQFVDQNGDGCIDEADKVVIGDPNPDFYGNIFATLVWKRFTLNVAFNYSVGNDVFNYERSILNSGSTLYNQQVAEVGHWRYEGQQTDLPKVAFGDPMGNNRFSDRWIEDGSYLRLKTVSLAYQIPIPESWESWLQGISVWGEAHNLFTVTRYTGNDPEFSVANGQLYQGIDCGMIPQSRSFTLGVKINL